MSMEGEETTFSGRPFHKRMVFGKNVSLRRDVRDRGTKNLLVWPLVRVLSGTNWLSGMSISLLQIRYIIVTFDVALRCSRVFHLSSSVMAVTLLRLEKLFMTYRAALRCKASALEVALLVWGSHIQLAYSMTGRTSAL